MLVENNYLFKRIYFSEYPSEVIYTVLMTMPGTILILLVLARVMPGTGQLDSQPAFDPRVAEYVWFDTDNSGCMWDKEEEVKTVMSVSYMLPNSLSEQEVVTEGGSQTKLKIQRTRIRLG